MVDCTQGSDGDFQHGVRQMRFSDKPVPDKPVPDKPGETVHTVTTIFCQKNYCGISK